MKLKDQVCSLKLAKELKELGVKQESLWWWSLRGQMGWTIENNFFMKTTATRGKNYCSAFTVAELGEMLPESFHFGKGNYGWIRTIKCADWKRCEARNLNDNDRQIIGFKDKNEANARAKMLIYLKKQEGG